VTGIADEPPQDEVRHHFAPEYTMEIEGGAMVHIDGEAVGMLNTVHVECLSGGLHMRGLDLSTGPAKPRGAL